METLYESHVIPVFNGLVTSLSTLSRPVSTVTRTEYELATSTALPPQGLPQLPPQGLPQLPLFPQPNQFQVTSSPLVTQTMVTQTDSKVSAALGGRCPFWSLFQMNQFSEIRPLKHLSVCLSAGPEAHVRRQDGVHDAVLDARRAHPAHHLPHRQRSRPAYRSPLPRLLPRPLPLVPLRWLGAAI